MTIEKQDKTKVFFLINKKFLTEDKFKKYGG